MTSNDVQVNVAALNRRYAEERDKRLRAVRAHPKDDPELRGEFAGFDRDCYADANFARGGNQGAGRARYRGRHGRPADRRQASRGVTSLRIVEKGSDFGGTWYWNRYPGAACDVESYIYLPMLEQTGYMPKDRYARADEIRGYLNHLADRYRLRESALFQTAVTRMAWDEHRRRWIVHTGRGYELAARFVISATGVLSNPRLPKIPGICDFGGRSFHTSRWDYAYTGGEAD